MIELVLKGALSYLLGSVIGSLTIARLTGGADIRTLGSGNAGATNALRTQGMKVGLAVLVIDLAKGWIATAVIAHLPLPAALMPADADSLAAWRAPLCGIAVMLGHVYPLWYGFRGGKGTPAQQRNVQRAEVVFAHQVEPRIECGMSLRRRNFGRRDALPQRHHAKRNRRRHGHGIDAGHLPQAGVQGFV